MYGTGINPPPRRAIHGKVSQLCSLILTLGYNPMQQLLNIGVVKNRYGPHSADGSMGVELAANYAACQINVHEFHRTQSTAFDIASVLK